MLCTLLMSAFLKVSVKIEFSGTFQCDRLGLTWQIHCSFSIPSPLNPLINSKPWSVRHLTADPILRHALPTSEINY